MTLLIKVVFIYLILLISPEEQKVQTFNMPGDKSKSNRSLWNSKTCCNECSMSVDCRL